MVCDFIYTLPAQLYNDPATCHNNKLTDLINDGVREVDWEQAKTMKEGSSATNMTSGWKGTGRRTIGQKKIKN